MSESNELRRTIEALLFASERPLSVDEMREAFSAPSTNLADSSSGGEDASPDGIRKALDELRADYESQNRGFRLSELAGGFQITTDPALAAPLRRFYQARLKKRLSQATLETLSVVAYRQPVTRADIEFIRGVNVDAALKTILERDLVKVVGRKEVPGRPMLYGTTKAFLDHFGLATLKDLPALPEYSLKDIEERLLPPELRGDSTSLTTPEQGRGSSTELTGSTLLTTSADSPEAERDPELVEGQSPEPVEGAGQ